MTKEELLTKVKAHIAEEKADAQSYYELAKAAKENGENRLAFTLSGICNQEIDHFDKITKCTMGAEMTNPVTEKDKEEMDFLRFKLARM
jgi:hypothetical protein